MNNIEEVLQQMRHLFFVTGDTGKIPIFRTNRTEWR